MKTKTPSGVIMAGHPNHLSEPTRRFLRGVLVLMLALGSLIALSAQGQSNYTGAYYFNTFAGNAFGPTAGRELAIDKDAGAVLRHNRSPDLFWEHRLDARSFKLAVSMVL